MDRLLAIILLAIALTFLVPRVSSEEQVSEDLLVVNETKLLEGEYTIDGNIIVRDRAELLVRGKLFILQDYDYEHSIIVKNNASLLLEHVELRSNKALTLELANAKLELSNSYLAVQQIIGSDSSISIERSSLEFANLSLVDSSISITDTSLDSKRCILKNSELYATNTTIFSTISATDGIGRLKNSSALAITLSGDAIYYIYRVLEVYLVDRIEVPVGGAFIHVKHAFNDTLYKIVKTSPEGKASLEAVSDLLSALGTRYLGNYKLEVFYEGPKASSTITLPYHRNYTPEELTKPEINKKTVKLRLDEILITNFYSSKSDIILTEEQQLVIEDAGSISPSGYTYLQEGNIRIKNNASLLISENSILSIAQSFDERYFVLVEDFAELIITDSSVVSDYPLYVYLYDNSKLRAERAELNFTVILEDNSSISIEDCTLAGVYSMSSRAIKINNSIIIGKFAVLKAFNISISGSTLLVDYLAVETPKLELVDTMLNKPLELKDCTAFLTNVSFPELIVKNSTVYLSWWLKVKVINSHDLPVEGAEVVVYRLVNLTSTLYTTQYTDEKGVAIIPALSRIISEEDVFIGNYKLVAYYTENNNIYESSSVAVAVDGNKEVTLYFEVFLVPPLYISTILEVPTRITPETTITLTGEVLYNEGPERAAYAFIEIEIVETGEKFNVTADENGRFTISLLTPEKEGTYTLRVTVKEPRFNMTWHRNYILIVKYEYVEARLPLLFIGIVIFVIGGAAVCVRFIAKRYYLSKSFPY